MEKLKKNTRNIIIGSAVGVVVGITLAKLLVPHLVAHHTIPQVPPPNVTTSSTPSSSTPSTTSVPQKPMVNLPSGVENKLSSFSSRLHTVTKLPLSQPSTGSVLYISAQEGYSVSQFRSVWSKILKKPIVVWTGDTQSQTDTLWRELGYHSDPLPSSQTLYMTSNTPVPDAYEQTGPNQWVEMPGILRTSQINKWPGFFAGQDVGKAKTTVATQKAKSVHSKSGKTQKK